MVKVIKELIQKISALLFKKKLLNFQNEKKNITKIIDSNFADTQELLSQLNPIKKHMLNKIIKENENLQTIIGKNCINFDLMDSVYSFEKKHGKLDKLLERKRIIGNEVNDLIKVCKNRFRSLQNRKNENTEFYEIK